MIHNDMSDRESRLLRQNTFNARADIIAMVSRQRQHANQRRRFFLFHPGEEGPQLQRLRYPLLAGREKIPVVAESLLQSLGQGRGQIPRKGGDGRVGKPLVCRPCLSRGGSGS